MLNILNTYYKNIDVNLKNILNYHNIMQIPKLNKIVINVGISSVLVDKKYISFVFNQIKLISGQTPVKSIAKKSIANFKIREGDVVGCKVTLRRKMMYDFMQRLFCVTLPRVKDFRGLSVKSFDGYGNYSFGIKEHTIFPEININKVEKIIGMDIAFVTTAKNDHDAHLLLKELGMPFGL